MDNPNAFPQGNEWMDAEGNMRLIHEGGMTLRDYFAGQILPTALAWAIDERDEEHAAAAAGLAYQVADAMLAERSKP